MGINRKILSVGSQLKYIREFGVAEKAFVRGNALHAVIRLQPNVLSAVYTAKLVYKVCKKYHHKHLKVHIISPELVLHEGAKLPRHIYHSNGRLCLYFPKANEWDATMKIADYIIPWISEWIYFHENWVVTGTWEGGEAPHGEPIEDIKK